MRFMLRYIVRKVPLWIIVLLLTVTWTIAVLPSAVTKADGGTWQQFTYNGTPGSRPYFVYTPVHYSTASKVPLLVLLHGCTQTPSDFASGTQMNQLADQYNFIVAYPQQTSTYNTSDCWNWFDPTDQSRGSGEPAIISGIVQTIEQTSSKWNIDTNRVYVAGISAGAAMSVIMGATYPDVFAAIGVHSGLEYQAAESLLAGLQVMALGGPDPVQQGKEAYQAMSTFKRVVPAIVFHGTNDTTVNPVNGDQVVQQWMETDSLASAFNYYSEASFNNPTTTTNGQVLNGYSYTVFSWNDSKGNEIEEYWKINGMGHAWSGGSSLGSYTDPKGPNASYAMYQFFMNHTLNQSKKY